MRFWGEAQSQTRALRYSWTEEAIADGGGRQENLKSVVFWKQETSVPRMVIKPAESKANDGEQRVRHAVWRPLGLEKSHLRAQPGNESASRGFKRGQKGTLITLCKCCGIFSLKLKKHSSGKANENP